MTEPAIKRQAAPSSRDIDDDVATEILLRLPCAAVLSSRAVCKAWHRITTSAAFVAGHARRQPLELILHRRGPSPSVALETIPLATLDDARRRCLHVQYPAAESATTPEPTKGASRSGGYAALVASCDGLLLFKELGGTSGGTDFFACNPVTRQRAVVPRPPGTYTLPCGFYVHKPSGEHRVLCLTNDQEGSHYVCSLEAAGASRLGPAPPFTPLCPDIPLHHAALHGKLHWLQYPSVVLPVDDGRCPGAKGRGKIVAFDTESETFRRVPRPPRRRDRGYAGEFFLLEVDGMLAMSDFLDGSMDIWVLEDHDSNDVASRRLRIRVDLPSPLRRACWAMDPGVEGRQDVILLGDHGRRWVALYDVTEKKVLKQIQLLTDDRLHRFDVFVFRASL